MIVHEPDPGHWANNRCAAWWPVMPGEAYGSFLSDLAGNHHFKLIRQAGTANRPWTTSVPVGALGDASVGPFSMDSAANTFYATCNAPINVLCPTSGTLAFWLRPPGSAPATTTGYTLIQGDSTTTHPLFQVAESGGHFYPGWYYYLNYDARATWTPSGGDWTAGKWMHMVLTWKVSDYVRLYVNGALKATSSAAIPSTMPAPPNTLGLGCDVWNLNGNGIAWFGFNVINDLCVWSYQMSAAQALLAYNDSRLGWPNRLLPTPYSKLFSSTRTYLFSGVGGMPQGGYPTRTSVWIMPGIGGLTDGGHAGLAAAFGPAISGGLTDGGDTAAPLAWDTFTGTSGTLLQNHTPDDGGAWLKHPSYSTGDARLNGSGAVYSTSTNDGVFLHSHVPASADYTVSCDLSHVSNSFVTKAGVSVRWDSSANTGYTAYATNASGNKVWLQKTVAGTTTSLGNAVSSWDVDATDRLSLSVIGTSLRVYWDGALVIGPITDSSISSAGQAGLYTSKSEITADNWTSTGGGVQAQYHLVGSGGEELGGFVPGGNLYVQPCAGGVYQGGKRLGPVMDYGPSAAGGTRDGGFAGPHLLIVETASGGTELGGEVADVFVVIATSGGMAAGGERLGPVMDYGPSAIGGIRESGLAESTGIYVIEPAGGQHLGGTSQIILGILYRLYQNDGAGGPIDYSTVIGATASLSYVLDPLTGPGVWSFGVRAYDTDVNLEDLNIDAVLTVRLDAASHDITNIPAPPLALTGHAGSAGSAVLSWQYQQPEPGKAPTGFRIYQGTGSVNYSSPVATVPWGGQPTLSATIPGLTDSTTYLFGVRAYNATGEEPNTSTVSITAKVSAPSAPASITISAVA